MEMAGICWEWLEMAGNSMNLQVIDGMAWKYWNWLKIVGYIWKWLELPDMDGTGWKWLEWLEIDKYFSK